MNLAIQIFRSVAIRVIAFGIIGAVWYGQKPRILIKKPKPIGSQKKFEWFTQCPDCGCIFDPDIERCLNCNKQTLLKYG